MGFFIDRIFDSVAELSVSEIAERVGGAVAGDPSVRVGAVAPLAEAGPGDLSLVANARYLPYVQSSRAAAVLVTHDLADQIDVPVAQVRVKDAHAALAVLLPLLYPDLPRTGAVHPSAVVEDGAALGADVSIGAYAVIGKGSVIGDRVRVGPHSVVGEGCVVGADTEIAAHVTLYRGVRLGERCIVHSGARIGADGFGYVFMDGGHRKVPQVGGCRIHDDVEIGANTTIDRGSIGDTVVGRGTKIDNLVHLGHNVRVGEHVIIIAQVGVSGSTTIGDGAIVAGQAGVGGHLSIGARARVGAQAGVTADVAPGETVSGYPARPHREALRAQAALFRLPELLRRVKEIEKAFGRAGRRESED
jgi:UDP-3-O-[3-hydroxymyristoyl] glucosamine N-acyltransferase